jgi:predicted metalloprotease
MKLFVVAVLVLTLALAGCNALPTDSVDDAPPTDTVPSTSTPAPAGASGATATAAPASPAAASSICGGGSLEGCFTYSQMNDYLDAITPMVAQFFEATYPRVSLPEVAFIPSGRVAREACGLGDSDAYEYCDADQTIYIGQDLLWAFYKQAGDAAPAIGLAHEWGHHLQTELGVPFARTASQSVTYENQADCISGAWARYAGEQGWLEPNDDLQDVQTLLQNIGSREGPGRDHGTTAEREQAFNAAFDGGIAACDAYSPGTPVG